METIAFFIAITGSILLLICAFAFFKARDVFTMTHVIMIANLYIIPIILIGVEIERFSIASMIKIIVAIILNIVVVNLLCHTILRRAMINNIFPDAKKKG